MATRIYAGNPGETSIQIRENVGPTATSAVFALVVDLATTTSKHDMLQYLKYLTEYVMRDNSWPPA